MSIDIRIPVDGGHLAALDFGGVGQPVLLVHGTGHNAAAWTETAADLLPDHHVVAVDLRGHGHSSADSTTAEQYWRDLATVVAALGWTRPVLVGHSTGGYAVAAVAAAGLLTPAALGIVDGLVLDDRTTTAHTLAEFRTPRAETELVRAFGYGRRLAAAQLHAWIDEQVSGAGTDWLNAGASPDLVRAVATRSFVPDGADLFLRRPTTAEIATTTTPDLAAPVYPSIDLYDHITAPITIVLPDHGFYAHRRHDVTRIVAAAPHRRLVDIDAGHNVVMTHPAQLASIIRHLTDQ